MLDFGKVVSSNLADIEPKTRKLLPDGAYEAVLANVEFPKYKKETSEGIRFTYRITSGEFEGEEIVEDVIYKSAKGELDFNFARIKSRILAFGVSMEGLAKFKWPKDNKGFGGFKDILENEVTVLTKTEKGTDGHVRARPIRVVPKGSDLETWGKS